LPELQRWQSKTAFVGAIGAPDEAGRWWSMLSLSSAPQAAQR
jgi:hypothetical protein